MLWQIYLHQLAALYRIIAGHWPEFCKIRPLCQMCQTDKPVMTKQLDTVVVDFYQRSGSLRLMHSNSAVRRSALFWIEISDVFPGLCWSHTPSLGITAPNVPINTRTKVSCMLEYGIAEPSSSSWSLSRLLILVWHRLVLY